MAFAGLDKIRQPDWQGLIDNILRKGTPARPHFIELFHDPEIRQMLIESFELAAGISKGDPHYDVRALIATNRFAGLDYVQSGLAGMELQLQWISTEDTAGSSRKTRNFIDEHTGPITNWDDFEKYPWPNPNAPEAAGELEWLSENLPEDMCISCQTGHFCENLAWMLGYETLCYALYDNRELVKAIADKTLELHTAELERLCQFERVQIIWGSDDMGFKNGLLFSAADMREFVLPGHKKLAKMAHDAGKVYILHSCGKLDDIIDDLAEDVKLDGKHSFEDTIENVCDAKDTYGQKMALLGGIDIDFLCRSDAQAIRKRVRETLDKCLPGGGYCLGTGNSVANYIPLDNYLAMLDEGFLYGS